MNTLPALTAHRQRLVACATLQRVRLVHEWHGVQAAVRPAQWAVAAAGIAGVALALASRRTHAARDVPVRAGVWAARALSLWRLVRALRRLAMASAVAPATRADEPA